MGSEMCIRDSPSTPESDATYSNTATYISTYADRRTKIGLDSESEQAEGTCEYILVADRDCKRWPSLWETAKRLAGAQAGLRGEEGGYIRLAVPDLRVICGVARQKALKKHCICNTFLLACIDNN